MPVQVEIAVLCITHSSASDMQDFAAALPDGMAGTTYRVVVIDSGSKDSTASVVEQLLPEASVLELHQNVGFAAAINRGMEFIRRSMDAESIMVMNPDVRLHPRSAATLLNALRADPRVAIAVPRLVDENGALQWSLRNEPRATSAWAEALLGAPTAHRLNAPTEVIQDLAAYDIGQTADWATGGMLLISHAAAMVVGDWDERYFLYEEEVDYCLRAAQAGYLVLFVPEAQATRVVGVRRPAAWAHALMQVNRFRHVQRRGRTVQAGSIWLAEFMGDLIRLAGGRRDVLPAMWALLHRASPQQVADRFFPEAEAVVALEEPRLTTPVLADASVRPVASVVIPAHNEERAIRRTLEAILADVPPGTFDVVVVCNGCTDDTAGAASQFGSDVVVLDVPEPSKYGALKAGDRATDVYPRIYVDADIEVSGPSLMKLAGAVRASGRIAAAAPERHLERNGVSLGVQWYYDVWEHLPQVRSGLFGRGVIALSETGHRRIESLPSMMSDDLAVAEAFAPHERTIVTGAQGVVRPPRTVADLLRRRIRVATGNAQIDLAGLRTDASRTSVKVIVNLVLNHPRLAPKLPVFLGVTLASKLGARRAIRKGDYQTWLRDESSRD